MRRNGLNVYKHLPLFRLQNNMSIRNNSSHIPLVLEPIRITMPALSPTMEMGTVTQWLSKEGDPLLPGESLCLIETDKAVVDYEIQDEAILAQIIVPDNTEAVPVGTLLAYTVEDQEMWMTWQQHPELRPRMENDVDHLEMEGEGISKKSTIVSTARTPLIQFRRGKRSPMTAPAAPSATATLTPATSSAGFSDSKKINTGTGYTDVPLSNMRKVIAKRLTASKATVPHAYSSIACEIDTVLALRKRLNTKTGLKLTLNDFLLKAVSSALVAVPVANSTWNDATHSANKNTSVDVSVAVATDAGLITPIVTNVEKRGLVAVHDEFMSLVKKARTGALSRQNIKAGHSRFQIWAVLEFKNSRQ